MNIFHKVTLEILKKNKTRTIVTIIGIILSAAMFTAVTSTISSLQNYMLQNAIYNSGDWHVSAYEVDASFFDFLKNPASVLETSEEQAYFAEGEVESYVYNQQIGYAIAEGCTNEYKPYLYIIGADKAFCMNMPVHLTGGRLPEKSNEILLPEHLAENGEVYYKLGDVLTLEIGNRVSDGYVLGQHNPYSNDETAPENESLEIKETRTYTVVGFYERPNFEDYSAPGYTAITTLDKVRPENAVYNVYFKMEDPKDALEWFGHLPVAGSYNDSVLTYLGVSEFIGFYSVLYGLAAIICGLIMFGSVSLIYNAFSISVSERTKQFGLLSSIGATQKQLRSMVLFEALFVSVIGIPLGILAGVGGMGVTFHFIGNAFSKLTDYPIPLTLSVNGWAIVAASIITLFTVLISAWIPSERATLVTAVEAIRQSSDVKLTKREQKKLSKAEKRREHSQNKRKPVAKSAEMKAVNDNTWGEKMIYRMFGFSGLVADKYYKRSKKKYRATVLSLFMSIVLFVSASALTSYLTDSVESSFAGNGYDLVYSYNPTMYMTLEEIQNDNFSGVISHEELSELLGRAEKVTAATYVSIRVERVDIAKQYLSDSYISYMMEKYEKTGVVYEEETFNIFISAYFVEDSVYEAFLEEQKLDKEVYMNSEEPQGVVIDGKTEFDYDLGKYVTTNILKSDYMDVILQQDEETEIVLPVGEILQERPYFASDLGDLAIIYPYSARELAMTGFGHESYLCDHYILSDDHESSYADLKNIIVENGLSKHYLYDYAEGVEESRTLIMIIQVFSYGFIVLISLIAAANVFNTISTNISLRRREFAMLKSVGMSSKEMNHMMNFECILYGSRALLYGIPVSMVITWLIYKVISEGFTTGFYLPWTAIMIAVCSVFLVVFATMMYSMKKIKADNPIDALKNENL